jgi:hypothetical protein
MTSASVAGPAPRRRAAGPQLPGTTGQLELLEPLHPSEDGMTIDVTGSIPEVVGAIKERFRYDEEGE